MNVTGTIFDHQPITKGMVRPADKFNIVGKEIKKMHQDTYVYENNRRLLTSTYSLSDLKNKSKSTFAYTSNDIYNSSELSAVSETQSVQSVNSTNSTSNYYDVIINRCAKKAGVSVSSTGTPHINSASEGKAYNDELNRIKGAFWCQTGGWSNLAGDGSSECMRTAMATMVSINSGYTVTPNDTGSAATSVTVNGVKINRNNNETTYDSINGAKAGLTLYDIGSEDKLIDAINNELMNNRSVVVKTTKSGEHWVTVTGTKNGKPATSFDDFIGVDPWYNGGNKNNPSTSSGTGSDRSDYSGVITLSSVSGQNLHSQYRILTYK